MRDYTRDTLVNNLLSHYGYNNGILIYNLMTTNPVEIVIQVLSAKFGLSKIIITLILVFLL